METTKKQKKSRSASATTEKIVRAYKESLLLNGKRPESVYKFCVDLGMKEEDFYSHFGSFEGLEKKIWKDFMDTTISRLNGDKTFHGFSTQEKVLALYYTLMEEFRKNRSFIVHQLEGYNKLEIVPAFIKDFKHSFEGFLVQILAGGQNAGEIARRPYLDKRYPQLFWVHFALLLFYWKSDDSPSFEQTDAYVEKSVRLVFDLIGTGVVDSAIDFAKFMIQSKLK
jgi:AcrR family transcriptional regulator